MLPVIAAIVAVLVVGWLFLCAPSGKRRRTDKYAGVMFAHRGLHCENVSENSLAAFERTCEHGYGIELDVQFTKDKQIVVFHDDNAVRMTGRDALIRNLTLEEVRALKLKDDDSGIPTFAEVLAAVNGRVPLLVEIKTCPGVKELTRATVDMLREYKGDYIVESFNPICVAELRKYAPEIIRGQLVTGRKDYKDQSGVVAFLLSQLMLNVIARPDFIAYNAKAPVTAGMQLQKKLFRTPLAAWTITNAVQVVQLSKDGIMPIFENIGL